MILATEILRAGGVEVEGGLCAELVAQFLSPYLAKS